MTTAIAKTQNTVKDWLKSPKLKGQIAQALPKHCTPDRFMRVLFTAMQRTPKLMQCTKESLYSAFITCSQLGIEPDGRNAHMIPYEDRKRGVVQCQLIIDYKGIVELVHRSGLVSYVHADVVCENDLFKYSKGRVVEHEIDLRKPRGEAYAAYALCVFKDGTEKAEVMSVEDIELIRARSKAGKSGPWVTDWNEMAKKTVFRRLSKWLPLSAEQRDMIEADDDQFEKPTIQIAAPVFKEDEALAQAFAQTPPEEDEDDEIPMEYEDLEKKVDHVADLKQRCELEGVEYTAVMDWAAKRKFNVAVPADAAKVMNAWDVVCVAVKEGRS